MPASAENNLLFGLLALQNGLVDQSALVAAFHAWTRDKARSMAEILLGHGAIDAEERALLEGLASKHLKRHSDNIEKSLAAVSVPRAVVTGLSAVGDADVEATLGHVAGSGSGSRPTELDEDSTHTATLSMGGAAGDGQRFRVLRPHARGGLGAVFVALDAELNREVALKQILDHHADDPASRTRFILEAEITGGLEHPGIVPVYGLGSDDNGRPYYAMRFVKGDTLKGAIAAFHADARAKADPGFRSLALRKLLRRFSDVCNAIEYAHTRGVIHRDIKPSNVIVGRHGETLVVDWGLAKAVGRPEPGSASEERTLVPPSVSGSAETLPGSALGTPSYMSPEQASGDLARVGPRSDVYSLGATLYSVLTGKPPFEGDDHGAVLTAVLKGDFPPPRLVDPTIDRALEAVCLKAMAPDPKDRYSTPRALADDVERWAADEPVTAWREPTGRRARRWGRRNRTAVAVGTVAVLAALFGTGAVLAVQTNANGVLKQANRALVISNMREMRANASLTQANLALADAKDRETMRFGLAMEAIKLFHGEVGDDLVLKADQFKPLRDKLLKGAAGFYGKLEGLLKDQPDRVSRKALGDAYFELGDLTAKIGDRLAALAVHRQGLAVRRELASDPSADAEDRGDLARSLHGIGFLSSQTGQSAEALARYEEARDLLGGLPPSGPGSDRRCALLGTVYRRIGIVLEDTGKTAGAMSAYKRSVETMTRLADEHPKVAEYRRILADAHNDIGVLIAQTGKPAEALESYRRALAIRQKLADDDPAVTIFRSGLADSHNNIGALQTQTGKPDEALESYRRALAIRQKLADDNPAVTNFRNRLADSHNNIGALQTQTGKPDEALESYRRALAIYKKLVDDNPAVTNFRSSVASSHHNIGFLQAQTGHPAEAMESYRRARAIYQELAGGNATVPKFREQLARVDRSWGELLLSAGNTSEAISRYEAMRATLAGLVRDYPSAPDYQSLMDDCIRRLATALRASGRASAAIAYYRRSLAELEARENPTPTDLYNLACYRALIAGAATEPGSGLTAAEGRLEAEQAVAALRRAFAAGFTDLSLAREGDPDLAPIRSRPDFQYLMMDLAFPADPFVSSR